jgi:hypothetical protein
MTEEADPAAHIGGDLDLRFHASSGWSSSISFLSHGYQSSFFHWLTWIGCIAWAAAISWSVFRPLTDGQVPSPKALSQGLGDHRPAGLSITEFGRGGFLRGQAWEG